MQYGNRLTWRMAIQYARRNRNIKEEKVGKESGMGKILKNMAGFSLDPIFFGLIAIVKFRF